MMLASCMHAHGGQSAHKRGRGGHASLSVRVGVATQASTAIRCGCETLMQPSAEMRPIKTIRSRTSNEETREGVRKLRAS